MNYRIRKVTYPGGDWFHPEYQESGWRKVFFDWKWRPISEKGVNYSYSTFAEAQEAIQKMVDEESKEVFEEKEVIIPMEVFNGYIRQEFKGRD